MVTERIVRAKLDKLKSQLAAYGRVAVAFSGGVDSSFLLWNALEVLGRDRVVAFFADSCLVSNRDRELALGWPLRHREGDFTIVPVSMYPLEWSGFSDNLANRCYICKCNIYSCFMGIMVADNYDLLLDGTNLDDLELGESGRPGLKAIRELGVLTPLADAGLTKDDIRYLGRLSGLDSWNIRANSCLATRVPSGRRLDSGALAIIERGEEELLQLGFTNARVYLSSCCDNTVKIMLQSGEFSELLPEHYTMLESVFAGAGFSFARVLVRPLKDG